MHLVLCSARRKKKRACVRVSIHTRRQTMGLTLATSAGRLTPAEENRNFSDNAYEIQCIRNNMCTK